MKAELNENNEVVVTMSRVTGAMAGRKDGHLTKGYKCKHTYSIANMKEKTVFLPYRSN